MHSRRLTSIGGPATTVVVAAVSLAVALAIGGGIAAGAAGAHGEALRIALPYAQLLVALGIVGTLGALAVAVIAIGPASRAWRPVLDIAAGGAAIWTLGGIAAGLLEFLLESGLSPSSPGFSAELGLFLTQIPLGTIWLTSTALAATVTVLAALVRGHTGAALVGVVAAAAVVPLAGQGAAADIESGDAAGVELLALLLVSAAVWFGSLGVLAVIAHRLPAAQVPLVWQRIRPVVRLAVLVVAVGGAQHAVVRLGAVDTLVTPYGVLVIITAGAVVALALLAAVRRRTADGVPRRPVTVVAFALVGVAIGFGVALGVTAPPAEAAQSAAQTPAAILTGRPLPAPLTLASLVGSWRIDLSWTIACAVLVVTYLVGARRAGGWPVHRSVAWTLGVLALWWLTNGGPNVYREVAFAAQLLALLSLATVIPLLLVIGAPLALVARVVPRRTDGTRGLQEWIGVATRTRIGAAAREPVVAALLLAGSLVLVIASPVLSWATTGRAGQQAVDLWLLAVGCVFVRAQLGAPAAPPLRSRALRLLAVVLAVATLAAIGVALANSGGLLLANWYGAMGWGTSALAAQQAAAPTAWCSAAVAGVPLAILVLRAPPTTSVPRQARIGARA